MIVRNDKNSRKERLVALTGAAAIALLVASIAVIGAMEPSYQQLTISRGFITSWMIRDNSITSDDLKDGSAVRSGDIVDGQVNNADLANGAVTSDKIRNGEVKAEDLDPSIELGGSSGFSLQVTERSNTITSSEEGEIITVSVQCNSDEVVTGGGYSSQATGGGISQSDHLLESKKQDNGWSIRWVLPFAFDITVYAECLKVVPAAE